MRLLTRRGWMLVPAGAALLATWTPSDDGITVCPFALATGHACPGCGLTRAISHLLRGDLGQAIAYHPLAPLIFVGLSVGAIWWWGARFRGWSPPRVQFLNIALILLGVLLIGVWVGRMATGTLPPV